ncbi:MAG: shikimate dehydrogenase [Gaiellales bacterium]|jgi:shikimate dehydrogenase|nr:shikimate dehydrogenase [Gaiellales bacterium]MDX6618725.1 shikimate dehydrogenase [Gaiellales bacterium]
MEDACGSGLEIGGATRVACVLGDPVEHSRSPRMHNAASAALGLDRVYVALRVEAAGLAHAIRGLVALGFEGANVTVPHKTAALALCDELGPEADDAGAVNTLSFDAGGRLRGDLTDGLGLLAALPEVPPRAIVLGAGGSARAAASALLRAGTPRLTVVARRLEAAGRLADVLTALVPEAQVDAATAVPGERGGLLVHCTPVGGIAALKALPVAADVVERMDAVADFAYRADGSPTPLSAAALAAGLPLVDGLELLVQQGALSFRRWTGLEPPLEVMRRAARGE